MLKKLQLEKIIYSQTNIIIEIVALAVFNSVQLIAEHQIVLSEQFKAYSF